MKKTTLFSLVLLLAGAATTFCMNESTAGATTVHCADNESVEINAETLEALKAVSLTVSNMLEDCEDTESSDEIYLPNIPKQQFEALLPYLKAVHAINQRPEDFQEEEKNKLKEELQQESVEQLIYHLMNANYLDVPVLLNCCTTALANKFTQPVELQKFVNDPEYFSFIGSLLPELAKQIAKKISKTQPAKKFLNQFPILYKKLQNTPCLPLSIAFSEDGKWFASGHKIAFSKDGKWFASESTFRLFRLTDTGPKPIIEGLLDQQNLSNTPSTFCTSSVVNFASGAYDKKTAHLYRLTEEGIQPITKGFQTHASLISTIAFSKDGNLSKDGKWLVFSQGGDVHLYRVTEEGPQQIRQIPNSAGCSISFSPDGDYFASTSMDGTVYLYGLRLLNQFIEGNDLVYSLFLLACHEQRPLVLTEDHHNPHHLKEYFNNLSPELLTILQQNEYVQIILVIDR